MFIDSLTPLLITYPTPAAGWNKGIYTERKPEIKEVPFKDIPGLFSVTDSYVQVTTINWTETESTGFGIYPYTEGVGFKYHTGLTDGKWCIKVKNDSENDLPVSILANGILKINSDTVPANSVKEIEFTLCSVEEDTIIQIFVPTKETVKENARSFDITITDIGYNELPKKAPKSKPTIYIASDSTVQSYERFYYPQTGWGQVLYRFFNKGLTTPEIQSPDLCYPQNHIYETPLFNIENRSIGARSARSFINEGKWDRLLSLSAPGDYCFIQWGHNDATAVRPNRFVAPEDFGYFIKKYVASCRARGITIILVTPIARRNCDDHEGRFVPSFGKYRDEMVKVAESENVPYVDLCNLTVDYLNSIGSEESKFIYLWAEKNAYPDGAYADGVHDNTHLQEYGATMYAKLVAEAILKSDRKELRELKPAISTDFKIDKPAPTETPTPTDETRPTGFAIQEIHSDNGITSFLLIWDDVKGAVSYTVYRKGSVDFQFFPLKTVTADEKKNSPVMPFTIPSSDVYQIYVEANFADKSTGAQSRIIEFRA